MKWKPSKRFVKRAGIGLIVALGLAQFITIDRTNPPVQTEIAAPPEVMAILHRSCYDCHSNQTVWPWYSHVAPASWLLSRDVHEGREEVNFTEWNTLPADKQARKIHKAAHEVAEGGMPLWFYLPMHPKAKLSDKDKATIQAWADSIPAAPGSKPEADEE